MRRTIGVFLLCLLAFLGLTGCSFLLGDPVNEIPLSETVTVEIRDESGTVWLENRHVQCVSLLPDGDTGGSVLFFLNAEGSNAFHQATEANLGKTMSLCINGKVVWEPIVEEVVQDTMFMVHTDDYEESIQLFEILTK